MARSIGKAAADVLLEPGELARACCARSAAPARRRDLRISGGPVARRQRRALWRSLARWRARPQRTARRRRVAATAARATAAACSAPRPATASSAGARLRRRSRRPLARRRVARQPLARRRFASRWLERWRQPARPPRRSDSIERGGPASSSVATAARAASASAAAPARLARSPSMLWKIWGESPFLEARLSSGRLSASAFDRRKNQRRRDPIETSVLRSLPKGALSSGSDTQLSLWRLRPPFVP